MPFGRRGQLHRTCRPAAASYIHSSMIPELLSGDAAVCWPSHGHCVENAWLHRMTKVSIVSVTGAS